MTSIETLRRLTVVPNRVMEFKDVREAMGCLNSCKPQLPSPGCRERTLCPR